MRGTFVDQGGLFSYIAPEARVPANHPLRKIRELVRDVLGELTRSLGRLYASEGRPSIPPEQLLSALLLQVFYGIRSERQLMEQLDYNLLYRWFVGLSPDDPIWDPTTFTKNRDRLQTGAVFAKFMSKLLNHPEVKPLLSDEHFSVDGTLIEAWASQNSSSTAFDFPHGLALLRDPLLNKGTAFSEQERDARGLRGLLPAHALSQEEQAARILTSQGLCP